MCGKYGVGFSIQFINMGGILAKIINMAIKSVIFKLKNIELCAKFN